VSNNKIINLKLAEKALKQIMVTRFTDTDVSKISDSERARLFGEIDNQLLVQFGVSLYEILESTNQTNDATEVVSNVVFDIWKSLYAQIDSLTVDMRENIHITDDFTGAPYISVFCDESQYFIFKDLIVNLKCPEEYNFKLILLITKNGNIINEKEILLPINIIKDKV
jgi:hypothetical protein